MKNKKQEKAKEEYYLETNEKNEKKVVISIHDPWFLTGRCVHFYECEKWKTGCKNCPNLRNLFELKEDNCNQLWNLKKHVFDNIDIDLVCSSDWMLEKSKQTPIFKNQKNYHKIPLGIDYKKFSSITRKEAREKLEGTEEIESTDDTKENSSSESDEDNE